MKMLVVLALWIPSIAVGCLWVHGTTIDGRIHTVSGITTARMLRQQMATRPGERDPFGRSGEDEHQVEGEERQAVGQILRGELEEAIERLTKMEAATPGRYSTASNLGTAYELKGDNVNALKWIIAGISRNPESHYGTEWLHALILEAKVEAAGHPDHPLSHHLLEVPERLGADTPILVMGKSYRAKDVSTALSYQLIERMVFVKPKDPYVADLLYSFALLQANLFTVESGKELLQLAREYGFPDEGLLRNQETRFDAVKRMAQFLWWSKVASGVVAFVLLLCYCYRRKWLFLSSVDYKAHKAALAAAKTGTRDENAPNTVLTQVAKRKT